jgi:hypothetical protein
VCPADSYRCVKICVGGAGSQDDLVDCLNSQHGVQPLQKAGRRRVNNGSYSVSRSQQLTRLLPAGPKCPLVDRESQSHGRSVHVGKQEGPAREPEDEYGGRPDENERNRAKQRKANDQRSPIQPYRADQHGDGGTQGPECRRGVRSGGGHADEPATDRDDDIRPLSPLRGQSSECQRWYANRGIEDAQPSAPNTHTPGRIATNSMSGRSWAHESVTTKCNWALSV